MSQRKNFGRNRKLASMKKQRTASRAKAQNALFEALEGRMLLSSPGVWTPTGVGGTGTSYWANVNPTNPAEVFLGTDMGEIWHTTTAGTTNTWTTLDTTQITGRAMSGDVFYTSTPGTLFAIDGSSSTLKKTVDDGVNWAVVPGWNTLCNNLSLPTWVGLQLLTDPNSSQHLAVVLGRSVDGSHTRWWIEYSGDGGNTFTTVDSVTTDTDNDLCWLAGGFWDGSNVYIASSKGLYSSSNGGTTWGAKNTINGQTLTGIDTSASGQGFLSFAGSKSGGTTRFWATTLLAPAFWTGNGVGGTIAGIGETYADNFGGIYTIDVGQTTWTNKTSPFWNTTGTGYTTPNGDPNGVPTYDPVPEWLSMASNDINDVWVAGGDHIHYNMGGITNWELSSPIVCKSSNAGSSWNKLLFTGYDTGNFPGESPNQNMKTAYTGQGGDKEWAYTGHTATFAMSAGNSNVMTFTGGSDAFMTTDGGATWFSLSVAVSQQHSMGQAITQHQAYSSSMNETSVWNLTFTDPTTIFADCTDTAAIQSSDGGNSWINPTFLGTGPNTFYDSVYDSNNNTIYAVTADQHDLYEGTNSYDSNLGSAVRANFVEASTDGGKTWKIICDFTNYHTAKTLALDPTNPNVMYVGILNTNSAQGGIYKTTNLTSVDGNGNPNCTFAQTATEPTRGGSFSGMHPQQTEVLNNGWVVALFTVKDGGNSKTAGIWLSKDGGATWTDVSGPDTMPDGVTNQMKYFASGVTVDPSAQGTWYATTTNFGQNPVGAIYKTTDYGTTWSVFSYVGGVASGSSISGGYGAANKLVIRPGTKEMLLATQTAGMLYCADYTVANPRFDRILSMPFNNVTNVFINPFNLDEIYATTFGNGIYKANFNTIGVPFPATNVTATPVGVGQVQLAWNYAAPYADSYQIQYSTSSGFGTYTTITVPNYTNSSYLVTGLSNSTMYYFRIVSTNAAGNSIPSSVVSAKTAAAAQLIAYDGFTGTQGQNLNGQTGGSGWTGSWTSNGGTIVAPMNVSLPPDNTGNTASAPAGVVATRNLATPVLASGTTLWISYEYCVSSGGGVALQNADGTWLQIGLPGYNGYGFATTKGGTVWYPANGGSANYGDTHFVVASITNNGTNITVDVYMDPTPGPTNPNNALTWQSTGNAFSSSLMDASVSKIALIGGAAFTAQFDELRLGTTYADVAPKASYPAPAAPSGLTVTPNGQKRIDLSWTNNATNQEGFLIQSSPDGATWTTLEKTLGSQTTYSVTNLSAATTDYFRIAAYNHAGTSAYSATQNTVTASNVPAAVTNLTTTVSGGQAVLNWSDVSGETGYYIQYTDNTRSGSENNNTIWTVVSQPANTTTYTVSGLSNNKIYYFQVIPYNTAGKAIVSNSVSGVNLTAPTSLAASAIAYNQMALTWTNTNGGFEAGFTVQQSTDGVNWSNSTTLAPLSTFASSAVVTGLAADTQYSFRVRSYQGASIGAWSGTATGRTWNNTLLAYEGFNYPVSQVLNGQGGGIGWTGNWSESTGQVTIATNNWLPANGLLTSGNSLYVYNWSTATRNLSNAVLTSGSTLWIGFDYSIGSTCGLAFENTDGTWLEIGTTNYSGLGFATNRGGWANYSTTTGGNYGESHFVVASLANDGTNITVNMYFDPTPGLTNPNNAVTWNGGHACLSSKIDSGGITKIALIGGAGNPANYDELRLGTSYTAVAPIAVSAVPTGLAATPASSSQINLAWTDVATTETGYHVERSTDGLTYAVVQTLAANTTSWNNTGLASGTTYYYRVSSYNNTGDSVYSNTTSATTTGGSLPTVTVTATDNAASETGPDTGTYRITRTGSTASSLTVYYALSGTASNTSGTDYNLSGTWGTATIGAGNSYVDVTLTPVDDALVEGTETAILTISTNANYTVGSPSNDTVTIADNDVASGLLAYDGFATTGALNGQGGGSGWAGNWSDPNNAFTAVTDTWSPTNPPANSGGALITATSWQAPATRNLSTAVLQSGTTLWVAFEERVTARQGVDFINSSDGTWLKIGNPNYTGWGFATSRGTEADYVATTGAQNYGESHFVVASITSSGGTFTIHMYLDPTPGQSSPNNEVSWYSGNTFSSTMMDSSITTIGLDGGYYDISTSGIDELRLGSSYLDVAPSPVTAPAAPSGLNATVASSTQINLTWTDNSSNETGFKIDLATDSGFTTNLTTNTVGANTTTYNATGLTANTTYYFRVRATNSSGDSANCTAVSATTSGLLAYDGFATTGALNGQGGGSGWAGNWSDSHSGFTAQTDTWAPTNSPANSGYSVIAGQGYAVATRPLSSGVLQNGASVWVGFEQRTTAKSGVMLINSSNSTYLTIGNWYASQAFMTGHITDNIIDGDPVVYGSTSSDASYGVSHFIVAHISRGANNSITVDMYVDPTPGQTNPNNMVTWQSGNTFTWSQMDSSITTMGLSTGYYDLSTSGLDELRVGASYLDVAPAATVTAPTAPSGLGATVASQTQINLAWTDNASNETGFKVYQSTDGTTYNLIQTISTANTTSYNVTGLSANAQYYYKVTAFNAGGETYCTSPASVNATTLPNAPAAPSGLGTTVVSQAQINLGWTDNSSNETGFKIDRATDSGFTANLTTNTVGANVTTYNATGLTANTTYYFRVRATNSGGDSANCTAVNATTLPNAPAAPSGLGATVAGPTQINLSWTDNSNNETGFKIDRATDSGFTANFTTNTVGANVTTYNATGLSNNTTYYFRVRATNTGGDSANCTAVNATTSGLIAYDGFADTLGQDVSGQGGGSGWSGNWTDTVPNGPNNIVADTWLPAVEPLSSGNSLNVNNWGTATRNLSSAVLTSGSTLWVGFDYAIGSSCGLAFQNTDGTWLEVGTTNYSGFGFATTSGGSVNYGTTSGGNYGDGHFVVARLVNDGTNITVDMYIDPTPGQTNPNNSVTWNAGHVCLSSMIDAGGVTKISLIGGAGTTARYDEIRLGASFLDVAPAPAAVNPATPSGLTATAALTNQVNLTWTDNSDNETGFYVDRATDSGFTANLNTFTIGANIALHTDTGLTANTTYYYRVRAYNGTGSSANTSTASATTMNTAAMPTALKALWRFDEGSGTAASDTDTDGIADTGTLNGTPTWATAKVGKGLTLNGTSQYIQAANSTDLNISGTGFSTAMWVKSGATNWNSTQTFISKGNGYKFGGVSGGKNIQFSLYIGSSWTNLTYTNAGDISASWHHYAATYDGANMRIWADGANVATLAKTGSIVGNTSVLYVGRIASTYLNGSVDEVRVYNTALASTDVSALYNQANLSVTGLTINSTNSASYSVQASNLATGVSQYGDQTFNFTTVPSKYLGSTWIKTAQADSTSTTANLMTFTVNQPIILYVAFDDAITSKPTWLTSQFTDTTDNIVTANGTFSVYKLTVSAGTIVLGGAGGTGTQGMYNVFFQNVP